MPIYAYSCTYFFNSLLHFRMITAFIYLSLSRKEGDTSKQKQKPKRKTVLPKQTNGEMMKTEEEETEVEVGKNSRPISQVQD